MGWHHHNSAHTPFSRFSTMWMQLRMIECGNSVDGRELSLAVKQPFVLLMYKYEQTNCKVSQTVMRSRIRTHNTIAIETIINRTINEIANSNALPPFHPYSWALHIGNQISIRWWMIERTNGGIRENTSNIRKLLTKREIPHIHSFARIPYLVFYNGMAFMVI